MNSGVVLYGLSNTPEEYVGGAGADTLESGPEALYDEVIVVGFVDGVEPGLEVSVLLGDSLELPGVVDSGEDLVPVTDDAGVLGKSGYVLSTVGGDFSNVEVVESPPEAGPFASHELPA